MTDYKLDGDVLTINDCLEINVPVSIDCNDCDAVVVKALWSIVQKQQARIEELDREMSEIVDARDYWEEKASKLAYLVGKLNGVDVGEHSNNNCPVNNAIELLSEVNNGC